MGWQHVRHFLSRRVSRKEYLGLHLTVGLVLSLLLAVCFGLVARQVDHGGALTEFDTTLGQRLAEHRAAAPVLRVVLFGFTLLGAYEVLLVLVPVVAVLFWLRRKWLLGTVWLVAGIGSSLINSTLKHSFARPRPPWKDEWVWEANESFPSGHSTASVVLVGLLAYMLVIGCPRWTGRVAILTGALLLILTIGFSRVYLGAHYFSDVVGGYCVGTAWLAVCITAVESVRLHLQRRTKTALPP